MSEYLSTAALILRAMDYKEADQLLTVYTRAKGKMTVLAKGVKKNNSKLRSGVLLFSQSELTLFLGKGIPVVINAESNNSFAAIRSDFMRMSYAGYCAELLDKMLVNEEFDEKIFRLIVQSFNLLSYLDPWLATKVLEIRLLEATGYQLNLEHCQNCQEDIDTNRSNYGVNGGLLCQNCYKAELMPLAVDTETITLIKALRRLPLLSLDYIRASEGAKKNLEQYLDLQFDYILEAPLKTRQFLRNIALPV